MKKKVTLGITLVALLAVAIIGGTLAWFTDSADATNKITTGKVDITLTEPDFTGENEDGIIPEVSGDIAKDLKVVPGDTIAKDPTITNKSSDAVKLRYKVVTTVIAKDGKTSLPVDGLVFKLNNEVVIFTPDADGFIYTRLNKDAFVTLFDKVEVPTAWGNEYQEATISIQISAEALQMNNTGDGKWTPVID